MPLEGSPRVLIVRLSALGDVLVTTPVSRALREALPGAYLAWLVEDRAVELLQGNPYLDEVLVWRRKRGRPGIGSLLRLVPELRARRFEWAVDCQGNLRSAAAARLSGARRVVGNSGAKEHADRFYHVRVARRTDDVSSRQRCLDLLAPLGVRSSDRRLVLQLRHEDHAAARGALHSAGVNPTSRYACLVPFTTWPQKHWVEDRWALLAEGMWARSGMVPVVLGGPSDVTRAAAVTAGPGRAVSLAGKTSLKAAAAVLAGARVVVAVDTLLMHAAAAVGTPAVVLCGASWWPGFADYENSVQLREPLPCSPCLHRPTCGGRFDCMRALTVERVLEAALAAARP